MSILNTLTLSDKTDAGTMSREEHLRKKMSDALEKQIYHANWITGIDGPYVPSETRLVENEETGELEEKRVKVRFTRWWWTDATGKTFVGLRYGNRPVEIQNGKIAVEVTDELQLVDVLKALQAAVQEGELDKQLIAAADARKQQMRKKPARKSTKSAA